MPPSKRIIVGFMTSIVVVYLLNYSYTVTPTINTASSEPGTTKSTVVVDENFLRNQTRSVQVKGPLASDAQELILLVSSLGRGGSSWIGELLASTKDEVMYVFEPMKIVSEIYKSRITPAHSNEILSSVFSCQFSKDLATLQRKWAEIFETNSDDHKEVFQTQILSRQRCRLAETVVVKTIRMPLAHVESLLNTPSFRHLKIIYLARDPRPQVLSRDTAMSAKNPDINNECPRIDEDVFAFHRLSYLFPGHFYFMRYEDMCQDPIGEAAQLWRFLQTNHTAEMPASWKTFLYEHMERPAEVNVKKRSLSTHRNSSTKWYEWRVRSQNSSQRLLDVEKECQGAMEKLGYIPLHTLSNLQNLSMPFIRNYSCDFWNCWSYKF